MKWLLLVLVLSGCAQVLICPTAPPVAPVVAPAIGAPTPQIFLVPPEFEPAPTVPPNQVRWGPVWGLPACVVIMACPD